MPLNRYNVTVFLLFASYLSLNAQQETGFRYGVEMQYGFIIPHASDLVAVSQSNPTGVNLSYDHIRLDKSNWDICNCFHYLGVNLSHYSFNNSEVLGSATSLSGSFEPILWKSNRLQLGLRSGFGVSYLSKVFDEETNPSNSFFSSPISFLLLVSPRFQWHLREELAVALAIHYNHISNGGQKQPNRGMNFPTLGLGINYSPKQYNFPKHTAEKTYNMRRYYLEAFGTLRSDSPRDGRQPLIGFTIGAFQKINAIQGLGAGFESQWDNSLKVLPDVPNGFIHAPFIAHHFLFGKVDFSQRMGVYVKKPKIYEPDRLFYQRYVLSYLLKNSIKLGVALKAHGHVAENIEVRLGYQF
ncbi:acyloxyacyl hydrolase [Lunatibacter salilacus]|uniref:acyloxyacyl hydrolase n=1 Tax=Lunatibacter salilacus TaxID=2483804 RepID=UPI001F387E54|nr:acyloxyacyl hydrolase [Lunatibacter salilacus]